MVYLLTFNLNLPPFQTDSILLKMAQTFKLIERRSLLHLNYKVCSTESHT